MGESVSMSFILGGKDVRSFSKEYCNLCVCCCPHHQSDSQYSMHLKRDMNISVFRRYRVRHNFAGYGANQSSEVRTEGGFITFLSCCRNLSGRRWLVSVCLFVCPSLLTQGIRLYSGYRGVGVWWWWGCEAYFFLFINLFFLFINVFWFNNFHFKRSSANIYSYRP